MDHRSHRPSAHPQPAVYSRTEQRSVLLPLHSLEPEEQPAAAATAQQHETLKAVYSSLCYWVTHLTAAAYHLPYGLTLCYLPANTGKHILP